MRRPNRLSRRDVFQGGGLLAATGLLTADGAAVADITPRSARPSNIYRSIGVRPIINCKGTYTIISGSQTLPEVKRAMDEASRHFVNLDELMEAVGRRLAALTGADWGIVTAGCAAALTAATSACIAGGNPETLQRLPDLAGLKNEVIIPKHSRNVYDHAVRMLGVKVVEVDSAAHLESAFGARTAMVMLLASPAADNGPLSTEVVARAANRRGVPVLVDAAAEILTIPSVHLKNGATLVAYSGGKCLRGPQCSGLLLGRKDLVRAAWINSAPHHGFGRSLKVGKEEIMGLLAAVEAWTKRDHQAEWKRWEAWLGVIAREVTRIAGVTVEVRQPEGLTNRAPQLRISWDTAQLGIAGDEAETLLLAGDPRIILTASGRRRDGGTSSLTIMPYMMNPQDVSVAAAAIHAILANPPKIAPRVARAPAQVDGIWRAHLGFMVGTAEHTLTIRQIGNALTGTHTGEHLSGDLAGYVDGDEIRFRSSQRHGAGAIDYDFAGRLVGGTMAGVASLDEYGQATWRAERQGKKA